jgi:hypothetical protein
MQRGVQSTKTAAENQHTVLFGIILLLSERTEKPRKDQSAYQTDERTKQREPKSHVGISYEAGALVRFPMMPKTDESNFHFHFLSQAAVTNSGSLSFSPWQCPYVRLWLFLLNRLSARRHPRRAAQRRWLPTKEDWRRTSLTQRLHLSRRNAVRASRAARCERIPSLFH